MGFTVRGLMERFFRRPTGTPSTHPSSQLGVTELKRREVPALFGVRFLGSPQGYLGDTAATHTGSLGLNRRSLW